MLLDSFAARGVMITTTMGCSGGRAKVGRAHGRHLRGAEVEGRRPRVPEAPLAPVGECCKEHHGEHDERDAQPEAELGR